MSPSRLRTKRILYPLTAAIILAYFLFFTWRSLFRYFDDDDMYNLYFAWSKPGTELLKEILFFWTGGRRPLGAIFYLSIFGPAGFDPLPFHIALLALCIVNIVLCFRAARLISGSDRVAALAALTFAFQTRMMEVWFRTGVIYDVLCFTFVWLAVCLYISGRSGGRELSRGRMAAIVACCILAFDAKEMAVCLPVFLAAYELLFQTKRQKLLICVIGVMAVAYTIGKLHGPDSINLDPDYRLEFSWARFASTWDVYLHDLFIAKAPLKTWVSMSILGGLAAVALLVRSRVLLFAWIVMFFGLLPVSFAPPRGSFVILVSWPGWVLFAAAVLIGIEDLAMRRTPGYRTALASLVFVAVGWGFGKWNLHDQRAGPRHWLWDMPAHVHELADQLVEMHPTLPEHARLLLVNDPFGDDRNTPTFLIHLLYEGPELWIDRSQNTRADWGDYQYVFTYSDGRYRQVKPAAIGF